MAISIFLAANSALQHYDDAAAPREVLKSREHTSSTIQPTTPENSGERKSPCWTKVASHVKGPTHDKTVALTIGIDVENPAESLELGFRAPETSSTPARSWDEQQYFHNGLLHIPTNRWRTMGH